MGAKTRYEERASASHNSVTATLYVGYETFRRNGVATNNLIHCGSGSLGVKPTTNLAIEVNAEGGNFAAGSISGFNYFIIGPRFSYRF